MSWNHRVMRHIEGERDYLAIHEVYYNNEGLIVKWTDSPVNMVDGTITGLRWELNRMKESLGKPVLEYDMQPEGEDDKE